MGVGEKWDALEDFHPARVASRILGMGDVVSLVEKAAQTIDVEKAQKIAQKMKKGAFDLDDMAEQLKQMQRIGGMSGVLGMMPGMGKIKSQIADANLDDGILKRQHAIITSMTPHERRNPKVLDARRKRRIAAGSGTKVEEVNRLIKMHRQMADMMKTHGPQQGHAQPARRRRRRRRAPSEAEMAAMQEELAQARPQGARAAAARTCRKRCRRACRKGLGGLGGGACRSCPAWAAACPASAAACRNSPVCRERRSSSRSTTQ